MPSASNGPRKWPEGNDALPERAPKQPAKPAFKYKPKFGIVVLCDDERHQRRVYNALRRQGLKLKVVCV